MNKQKLKVETNGNELILIREFDAPRALVFEAYSNCKHLQHWWGPREWPLTYCKLDFRVGGTWHFCMTGPEGMESWGMAIYKEIKAPEKIHYDDYFSDKDGNLNKEMPYTFVKVTFEESGGKTILRSVGQYPSAADIQKVLDMGMEEGVAETYDRLEEFLARTNS